MNLQNFEAGLDRWGADLHAWPAQDQASALALMARSGEARLQAERARNIETALSESAISHRAPGDLAARILKDSRLVESTGLEDPFSGFIAWLKAALWRPALLAVLPLAVGFALGASSSVDEDAALQNFTALTLISAFDEIDYEDQ